MTQKSPVCRVKLAPSILAADSNSFLVHWEGNPNLHRTVQRIKALGKKAGMAINPATPATVLDKILQDVEQVLGMTVNRGFGHQAFIRTTLPKIRRVRQMMDEMRPGYDLEVDGGIDAVTAPLAIAAGANVLVAGSALFGSRLGVTAAMKRFQRIQMPENEERKSLTCVRIATDQPGMCKVGLTTAYRRITATQ